MNDPTVEARAIAGKIQQALSGLGFCEQPKDPGSLRPVLFRRIGLVGEPADPTYILIEVDTDHLPRKVRVDQLLSPRTLHHLSAVCGRRIAHLNAVGATYCVFMKPMPKVQLPRRVPLDLGDRPTGSYLIPIGVGQDGPVWSSLFETGHILVGGESGSGKSTWLHATLSALLTAHGPDQLQLAIVDPKGVEFAVYNGIEYLITDIAEEVETATEVTQYLAVEIEERKRLFTGVLAKSLAAYNAQVQDPLPLIVTVIDELTDIALAAGLDSLFYKNLIRLASKARSFGIVLILATQNPKAEVLNTLVRGNLSTRIAFRVPTAQHSRTILGMAGAEELPQTIKGRMIARLGDRGLQELQGYLISDEEVKAIAQRAGADHARALSTLERELVGYALDQLDGRFPIDHLYGAFQGRISRRQLVKLAKAWERRGWLTAPASVTESRKVAPVLMELLG